MKKIIYYAVVLTILLTNKVVAQNKNQNMKNETSYSLEVIRYNIPQDQQKNFEQAYIDAGSYLKASKYCLAYQVIHGKEETNHYIVLIHWTSMDDHLNGFRKSAEFMPFFNLVKPFFNNIEEMKHYEPTSNSWMKE